MAQPEKEGFSAIVNAALTEDVLAREPVDIVAVPPPVFTRHLSSPDILFVGKGQPSFSLRPEVSIDTAYLKKKIPQDEEGKPQRASNPAGIANIHKLVTRSRVNSTPIDCRISFQSSSSVPVSECTVTSTRRGQQENPPGQVLPKEPVDRSSTVDLYKLYRADFSNVPVITHERTLALAERIANGNEKEKKQAFNELVEANLRLVVSIVRRFATKDNPSTLLDLIQDGNLGLMCAAEKFDYTRNIRFSTYAINWIMQAILRGKAEDNLIHIPIHVQDAIKKILYYQQVLFEETGQEPSPEAIAARARMSIETIKNMLEAYQYQTVASLDAPLAEDEGTLGEYVDTNYVVTPSKSNDTDADDEAKHDLVERRLSILDDRRRKVIEMRYGIGEYKDRPRTIEEVATEFGLTKERIRQLEESSLNRMRYWRSAEPIADNEPVAREERPNLSGALSTEITELVVHKLEEALRNGCNVKKACEFAQINISSYYKAQRNSQEFEDRMTNARRFLIQSRSQT